LNILFKIDVSDVLVIILASNSVMKLGASNLIIFDSSMVILILNDSPKPIGLAFSCTISFKVEYYSL